MSNKSLLSVFLLTIILSLSSCSSKQGESDKPVIAVTTPALQYLAETIAGDQLDVVTIIPAGVDAESFEPDMKSIKKLDKAAGLLFLGIPGFESEIVAKVKSIKGNSLNSYNVATGVTLLSNEHAGGDDPHILTSPKNTEIVARNIGRILMDKYPEKRKTLEFNMNMLLKEINTADTDTRYLIDRLKQSVKGTPTFVSIHPSLSYYAEYYGLRQITLEENGKEPSPRQLEQKLREAKELHPLLLIYEKSHAPDQAKVYAKQLGVEAYPIDFNSEDFLREYVDIAMELGIRN